MLRTLSSRKASILPSTSELFESYGRLVYVRCRQILGEEEAADAVQEVFMKVVEQGSKYRGDAKPSTWLYGIATLHSLQRLRNQKRRRDKLAGASDLWPTDTGASTADERITLNRLLAEQSEELRLMVYLRCVDELTMDEVAAVVGRSRKTVGKQVNSFLLGARLSLGGEITGSAS
jgi:RNA polymerase sigma-70 factor (ECF subfamily)